MQKQDALTGALVADAAAMGLHWLYDQEQIKLIEATGSLLFRQPEAAVYEGKLGYFAHAARRAGQLSHYGESVRVPSVLGKDYTPENHRAAFMATFGPSGSYHGYADKPMKQLVARIINEGEELTEPSGMDDDQMPGLCVVPGHFAADHSLSSTLEAVQVISTNNDVAQAATALHTVMTQVLSGVALKPALSNAAADVEGELGELMREALSIESYDPLAVSEKFGLACFVKHGMPISWYLLNHATSFETAVLDNIRCGGDSCGRSIALGSIAGLVFGIPDEMLTRASF